MRKLLLLCCAVLGLLMVSAISDPADARRGHGHGHGFHGGGHHHHHFGGRHFSHHRHHGHHRYGGIYFGAPYYYGYGYYGSCSWLRRNALRTGSRYWWNRYEACLYDY